MATRNIIKIGEGKHRARADTERRLYEESLIHSDGNDLDSVDKNMFVNTTAKAEYDRVLMRLREEFGIVGNLNKADLIAYANSYARYIDYVKQYRKRSFQPVIETNSGPKPNPIIKMMDEARRDMAESSRRLGMTVDGQLRAAKAKADKEEADMEAQFGAI